MLETLTDEQRAGVPQRIESEETIEHVWQQGRIINGHDPQKYRQDACGAWIMRERFGQRDCVYGWEIDLMNSGLEEPIQGGNMRPLQWENKMHKVGDRLTCYVRSAGATNV